MEKLLDCLKHLFFFVKMQWIDRIHTSSFVIGASVQNFVIGYNLYFHSAIMDLNQLHALVLRSSLFTATTVTFLASMSAVSNEFRQRTIGLLLLSGRSLPAILGLRAAAHALVCTPLILLPWLVAFAVRPDYFSLETLACIPLVYLVLFATGWQCTLLLNMSSQPKALIPWLYLAYVAVGLQALPWPLPSWLNWIFPAGWLLREPVVQQDPLRLILYFLATLLLSSALIGFICVPRLIRRIQIQILQGRNFI